MSSEKYKASASDSDDNQAVLKPEERKALFFDIDGTLLSEVTRQVPESAIRAINKARTLGHMTFINSGRTMIMLEDFIRMVPLDGVLAGCGTEVVVNGKQEYLYVVPEEIQQRLTTADKKYHVGVVMEGSKEIHMRPEEEDSGIERYEMMKRNMAKMNYLTDGPFEAYYEISKFCIQAGPGSDMDGFCKEFGDEFDIMDRNEGFYEAVPTGHSKGKVLNMVCERYGIKPENAYVFGDSSNDLPMFMECQNAIAMKVHDPVLDPYTTYVTDTPEDDGIEKAMIHFGII